MLVFIPKYEIPEIKPLGVTETDGHRIYQLSPDRNYVSVTSALSATADKSGLEAWRKRVGREEAEAISNRATTQGKALHRCLEQFVKGEPIEERKYSNKRRYDQVLRVFQQHVSEVYAIEKLVIDDTEKVAGTFDEFCRFDGLHAILDFKTTIHSVEEQYINDYFLQVSGYAYMLSKMIPFDVDFHKLLGVVIVASSGGKEAQVFIKRPVDYLDEFRARVRRYYETRA